MAVIATYKFDPLKNDNFLPIFNNGFEDYTITDRDTDDNLVIRTIEHDSLFPSTIKFEDGAGESDRSLLSVDYLAVTGEMTDLSNLFVNCLALKTVNTEGWDTSYVTNMENMFERCTSLESINVSGFILVK